MRKELLVLLTMLLLPYTAQGDAVSDPISYGLKIGETELTSDNVTADGNITGLTGITGTVKFMPANADTPATLILDNATIGTSEGPTYIMSNYENGQLTISLAGTNKLYGIIFDDSGEGTLAFTGNGSFNISCSDGPIGGYTDVDFGDFNLISSLPGIHYDNDDHRLVDYQSVGVREVTLTKTAVYPLWLGGVQVTDDNKGGITGGEISGTVTFNPTGNILTLTDASLGSPSSDYEAPIISDLPNLEISINGGCRIQGRQNVVIDDARGGIMSLDTDATLVLSTNYTTSSEANSPTMRIDSNPIASGFKSISTDHQMIYKRTSDYYWVQRIAEPTISLVDGRLQISDNNEIDLADAANSAVTLKYKITDASGTTGEEKTFNSETNEPIENPCKIDAWAVYQDQESDHSTGVYFGIADKTIVFNSTTSGSELKGSDLELLPATEDVEPTIIGTDAAEVVAFDAETGKATIAGVGTCNVMVKLSVSGGSNIQVLNPVNGEVVMLPCKVTVVPDEEEQQAKMTVSAKGFEGTYDGKAHSITVTVTTPAEGAVVKYGITEGSYDLTENPTYTDAGTYTVYYQVTKDGYEATTGNAIVKINKAKPTVTAPTAKENLTYTGGAQELINAGSTSGGEMQYSLDNATFSTSIPTGTEAKEYTVYYKVVGGTNYEDVAAASIKVTISDAKMTVSAKGFEGTYDGKAHSITVTVTTPAEGAVVKYGTTEGSYDLTENPIYTDAGTYTVYYQVTKDGYEATTGNAIVKINKAKPTVTAPTAKENLTYTGGAQELINAGSTSGGEMQYSLDNATFSTSIPTGTEAKEYTVYYKVVGGTNYEDVAAASIKVTISDAKMTVSAKGFEGTYDGKAHSITVTVTTPAEGAVVKYGTTEGSYDLDASPTYTDAGRYIVYYQVTKTGYLSVTGSEVISITPGTGSISFAEASVSKTVGDEPFTNALTNTGDAAVTYESSETNVATVDANGLVSIVGAGETTITATVGDGINYIYEDKTATFTLTVESQEEPEPQPEPVEPTLGWVDANQNPVDAVTVTFKGDYSALPTLSKTEGLEVTYNSSEASVATVDENGAVEIISAGTTTISAIFKGNDNYTEKTASYDLTVEEAQEPEPQPQPVEPTLSWVDASQNVVNAVTVTFKGDYSALPTLNKTEGLEVTYDSTDPNVASISETGVVNIRAEGTTTISAIFKGNDDYTQKTARYILTVNSAIADGYPLWVNGTQVTSNNWQDVLGHNNNPEIPFYIFNAEKKQLLIDHDQTRTTVIESRMPELNIYLLDVSKIDHIFFNNTGNDSKKGTLTFTTNGNFPGKLILANSTEGESAITGFSEINYKWNLTANEPDGIDYNTTKLQMECKGVPADNITIGEAIVPITVKKTIRFEETQLVEKDEDGHEILDVDGNPIPANLSNYAYAPSNTEKNVVLITLNPDNIGEGAGGFGVEDGFSGIYIGDTMTDYSAGQVANDVDNQNMAPGGSTYAENYDGFTFMLPAGYGIVEIDDLVEDGYEFHLIIGTDDPIALDYSNSRISRFDATSQHVQAEIHFNVSKPVYCFLYMVKKTAGARTRMGKRERAYGKLVSIQVMATTVIPTDPPSEATGGILDEDDDPEVEIVSGIREVKSGDMKSEKFNNRWYTLDGRPLQSKPTKAGIYLFNQKKVLCRGNE